ncbi:hypothetical protein A6A06_16530 [Streptomyces sp. CB02923]|nr:hypothetical protein A6A06_16530 [Streptomyces sp. CB02923]
MRLFRRPVTSAFPSRPDGQDGPAPHLQICAHTDDDLYFMSPDLLHTVRAGLPVVSVYLTTGESDGYNLATDDAARKTTEPDYPGYTAARQHGIRAAYAAMHTGSRRAAWTRTRVCVREGVTAETATLDDGHITLIFLNLRTCVALPEQKILSLWSEKIAELATLRPAGSPIPASHDGRALSRAGLIATLTDILCAYRPAVVRVMNPDPDRTAYNAATGTAAYCDNSDHTATALFSLAALRAYEQLDAAHRPAVESYTGYCNKLQPDNLSAQAAAEKFGYLAVYGGEDGHQCLKGPGECGDRPLGNRAFNRYYGQSTTHRWRGTTNWLQRREDGRLTAFAVLGGRPHMWTQDTPGGETWSGPVPVGDWPADDQGRCLPRLETVRDGQGRLHLVAARALVAPDPEDHRREIMHLAQEVPDGEFGTWQYLGSPHDDGNAVRRRALGLPLAAVTASGGLQVIVRNSGTGLSARTAAGPGWGPWQDLFGGTLEGATAVTKRSGHTEIYATTRTGMLRWYQQEPGGTVLRDYATLLPRPAGPVTLLEETGGRLLMISRQPGTGWLLAHRQHEPDGPWNAQPHLLDTTPGYGPVAATALPGGTTVALVQRRDDGTLALSRQPLDASPLHQRWTPLGGGPYIHAPATALDSAGRLVIATIGPDARLQTLTVDAGTAEPVSPGPAKPVRASADAAWSTHRPTVEQAADASPQTAAAAADARRATGDQRFGRPFGGTSRLQRRGRTAADG